MKGQSRLGRLPTPKARGWLSFAEQQVGGLGGDDMHLLEDGLELLAVAWSCPTRLGSDRPSNAVTKVQPNTEITLTAQRPAATARVGCRRRRDRGPRRPRSGWSQVTRLGGVPILATQPFGDGNPVAARLISFYPGRGSEALSAHRRHRAGGRCSDQRSADARQRG